MWNKIVRWDGENQIGCLEWAERPGRTYEMHLDVEPAHHRKGIGRSMFHELEEMVKFRKGMSIYSFCAGDNEKAQNWFKSMGFSLNFMPDFYGEGRNAFFLYKTVGRPE